MAGTDVPETEEWDGFYAGEGDDAPVWSGRPNAVLAEEIAELPPGTALDVGCGEGADAIWLAERGWRVTAVDPSRVALARAASAARAAGVEVDWVHAGLLRMPGGTGQHDLVSAQYAVLRRSDDAAAMATLLGAVAPGGTLLVVHHETGPTHGADHGPDPTDLLTPRAVLDHLDDGWVVEFHEVRPRAADLPPDAHLVPDVVLRARRRDLGDGRGAPLADG